MKYLKYAILVVMSILVINLYNKESTNNIIINDVNNANIILEEVNKEDEIVYENYTRAQLMDKINLNLNSNMKTYGYLFVDKSLDLGIDPFLSVAIMLHETGCKWECSYLVQHYNNVGGNRGTNGYYSYDTLSEGIVSYLNNIKKNYVDYGLKTAEQMQRKYTGYENSTWASKVNKYINAIKNTKIE